MNNKYAKKIGSTVDPFYHKICYIFSYQILLVYFDFYLNSLMNSAESNLINVFLNVIYNIYIYYFISGAVVMEGYYVYFDRENKTVSFADTTCSPRSLNVTRSTVRGYSHTTRTVSSCQYVKSSGLPTYAIVLIVVGAVLISIVLLILIMRMVSKIRRRRLKAQTNLDFHSLVDASFDTEY